MVAGIRQEGRWGKPFLGQLPHSGSLRAISGRPLAGVVGQADNKTELFIKQVWEVFVHWEKLSKEMCFTDKDF